MEKIKTISGLKSSQDSIERGMTDKQKEEIRSMIKKTSTDSIIHNIEMIIFNSRTSEKINTVFACRTLEGKIEVVNTAPWDGEHSIESFIYFYKSHVKGGDLMDLSAYSPTYQMNIGELVQNLGIDSRIVIALESLSFEMGDLRNKQFVNNLKMFIN